MCGSQEKVQKTGQGQRGKGETWCYGCSDSRAVLRYNTSMCGRFTLTTSVRESADLFQAMAVELPAALPHYNIPPSVQVLAVRQLAGQEGRQLVPLRWGLIPHW